MARQVQTREQLVAEVAALRLRVRALEDQPAPALPASEGVIAVDARGRVTLCNAAAGALTGWPVDDAQSQPIDQVLSIEDEFGPGLVRGTLHDGAARHLDAARIHRGDGSTIEVRLSVLPLTDKSSTVGALIALDPVDGGDPVADDAKRYLTALRALADVEWPTDAKALEQTARHALEVILDAIEADRAVVTLADDQATTVSVPDGLRDGVIGPVADLSTEPATASSPGVAEPRSLMALPLRARGRTAGMLSVSSQHADHFDPVRARVLAAFASALATSVEAGRLEAKVQQRESMLDAVHAITAVGASPATATEKLARIAQIAAWASRASVAGIRVEPANGQAYWTAVSGHSAPNEDRLEGFDPLCERTGSTTLSADPSHPDWPAQAGDGVATIVPIHAGAARNGSFLVITREPLESRVQRVLTSAADTLGLVLDAAARQNHVSDVHRREQEQLGVFRDAAAQLAITKRPESVLSRLVESALGVTGASGGCIAIWDNDGTARTMISAGTPTTVALAEALDRTRNALLKAGLPSARFAFDPDASAPAELASLLAVPFPHRDGPPGCLILLDKQAGSFTQEDERVLQLFSTMAAVLIDNLGLYETVERERLTLEAFQDSIVEGLLVLDGKGTIAFSNPAAATLLAPDARELDGQRLQTILRHRRSDFTKPEQLSALIEALCDVTDRRQVEIHLENPVPRDLAVAVFPIDASPDERFTGVLLRDVSDERELERRRDTFVSVASHELRTPMTTVLGFSELLLSGEGRGPRRRKWLQHIHDDSQRVVGIVDDLLNVSRIQSGKISVHAEPLALAEALQEAIATLKNEESTHAVAVRVDADLPPAHADASKLRQIATNLVSNALKYSPSGGPVTVDACLDPNRNQLVVSVRDRGIGISKADQAKLFQTFQRVDRPETRSIRGTGLGLFIVKGLVEFMGGEVGVESRLNHGSTFWFSLPIAETVEGKL